MLGVDCGTERTGYGFIESDGRQHRLIAAGVIRTSPRDPLPRRLQRIAGELRRLIGEYQPQGAAVEQVFHAANVKTGLKLAHARGAVLVALAEAGLEIGEYSPLEVKISVVGYGRAEKHQVQSMVQSVLHLAGPIESEDASDALAVAICHATRSSVVE